MADFRVRSGGSRYTRGIGPKTLRGHVKVALDQALKDSKTRLEGMGVYDYPPTVRVGDVMCRLHVPASESAVRNHLKAIAEDPETKIYRFFKHSATYAEKGLKTRKPKD